MENLSSNLSTLLSLLAGIIILGFGYPTSRGATVFQVPEGKPCAEGIIVIENRPGAPVRLSIKTAMCGETYSTVELLVENTSPKEITGYEISEAQDYEHKRDVRSSHVRDGGVELKPGQSKSEHFSDGFVDGYSYGKRVGMLKRNAFRITWAESSDGAVWGQKLTPNPQAHAGQDLVLRDDKEPFIAAFSYGNKTLSVMSCDEYGFGGPGLTVQRTGCNVRLVFDFQWRHDFSYHPRRSRDATITIKQGDNLHGEFNFDSCAKTAKGTIRDDNQDLTIMVLSDTDTSGKRGYCSGPPDYK